MEGPEFHNLATADNTGHSRASSAGGGMGGFVGGRVRGPELAAKLQNEAAVARVRNGRRLGKSQKTLSYVPTGSSFVPRIILATASFLGPCACGSAGLGYKIVAMLCVCCDLFIHACLLLFEAVYNIPVLVSTYSI